MFFCHFNNTNAFRSHSAPLAEVPKIKTEIEEETPENLPPIVMPVPLNVVIKEEVESVREEKPVAEESLVIAEQEKAEAPKISGWLFESKIIVKFTLNICQENRYMLCTILLSQKSFFQ